VASPIAIGTVVKIQQLVVKILQDLTNVN